MIVSRHLSEPDSALAQGHSLIPPTGFGSESSILGRARRAVRDLASGQPGPFRRLEFWTASHPLSFKLRLYSVTEPKVNMWQGFTWETLRYWQDLMSGTEIEPGPVLDSNGIMVFWHDDGNHPAPFDEFGELTHAEPFAD